MMPKSESIHSAYISARSRLTRAVAGLVPPTEVEDIVQEAYVRACHAARKNVVAQPQAFLQRVARNLALDYLKKAETRLVTQLDDIESAAAANQKRGADGTLEQVLSDERFALFCESVRRLPRQCRRAFVLKRVYGYSIREIAQEMELSARTVEKHIARGIRQCALFMNSAEGNRQSVEPPTIAHSEREARS